VVEKILDVIIDAGAKSAGLKNVRTMDKFCEREWYFIFFKLLIWNKWYWDISIR